jgi:hypothetical protein
LRQYPQIYIRPIKEPHYCASEIRIGNVCEGMRDQARRDAEFERPISELRFGGMIPAWDDYLTLFQHARCTGGWGG